MCHGVQPLAWQLMTELQRLRARGGPLLETAQTARRFVQAIDASVEAAGGARRCAAARRYRIDVTVLDMLEGIASAALPASEAQRIKAMLPEIVRQVARVEAGQAVAMLGWSVAGDAAPPCTQARRA
ncbi:hypothetical protein D3C81_322020 [compost metagenome]